ncbi:hypothetical protein Leryth_001140 [Lithospermum erythrorhizon]|nr:hypothetical protein Leryth_001140 [Lithospermum erythrorhizon]
MFSVVDFDSSSHLYPIEYFASSQRRTHSTLWFHLELRGLPETSWRRKKGPGNRHGGGVGHEHDFVPPLLVKGQSMPTLKNEPISASTEH